MSRVELDIDVSLLIDVINRHFDFIFASEVEALKGPVVTRLTALIKIYLEIKKSEESAKAQSQASSPVEESKLTGGSLEERLSGYVLTDDEILEFETRLKLFLKRLAHE